MMSVEPAEQSRDRWSRNKQLLSIGARADLRSTNCSSRRAAGVSLSVMSVAFFALKISPISRRKMESIKHGVFRLARRFLTFFEKNGAQTIRRKSLIGMLAIGCLMLAKSFIKFSHMFCFHRIFKVSFS
jgi:hypothetical protein